MCWRRRRCNPTTYPQSSFCSLPRFWMFTMPRFESAILSVASCLLGLLLALKAAPLVVGMLSTSQTIVRLDLHLDWRVFTFLAAAGTLTTFLFGLAPAFRASAVSPNEALKAGTGKQSARIGPFRPLVAVQTAFSFLVLFIAGLLL